MKYQDGTTSACMNRARGRCRLDLDEKPEMGRKRASGGVGQRRVLCDVDSAMGGSDWNLARLAPSRRQPMWLRGREHSTLEWKMGGKSTAARCFSSHNKTVLTWAFKSRGDVEQWSKKLHGAELASVRSGTEGMETRWAGRHCRAGVRL